MTTPDVLEPPFDYALLKTIGLVIFFIIFAGIVLRLVLAGPRKYDRAGRIPLEDEPVDERPATRDGATR